MQPLKFWILFAAAILLGIVITYVDSRPTWDDTGITAAAIFIVTALFGVAMPKRAWLWALAVEIWIPLLGFPHHNYGAALALIIAFMGAYAGTLIRKALGQ